MAALSDPGIPDLWELGRVRVEQLDPILREETEEWRRRLDWDFGPSADLVRRFVRMKALSGFALSYGPELAGYCYYVIEESKGLVGDLYVRSRFTSRENENRLLEAALHTLQSIPYVKRIEAQLMMLASPFDRRVPVDRFLHVHQRNFMCADLTALAPLPPGAAAGRARVVEWQNLMHEEAARLIADAYRGHIDSEINDQYRSQAGARRFLLNIVQYPGCGAFFPAASFVALEPATGELQGLCLSSLVASEVGHITQICTSPGARGTGVGYELLRHCLNALTQKGCRKVSLTVTGTNHTAVQLYERVGFHTDRTFAAYVWEGF